jgi:Ion channel
MAILMKCSLPKCRSNVLTTCCRAATVLTTIGWGDLVPVTPGQRVFVTIAMLAGALLYGYVIGTVSALLTSANEQQHNFYRTVR